MRRTTLLKSTFFPIPFADDAVEPKECVTTATAVVADVVSREGMPVVVSATDEPTEEATLPPDAAAAAAVPGAAVAAAGKSFLRHHRPTRSRRRGRTCDHRR